MDVYEAVRSRRAVRAFSDRLVAPEVLDECSQRRRGRRPGRTCNRGTPMW